MSSQKAVPAEDAVAAVWAVKERKEFFLCFLGQLPSVEIYDKNDTNEEKFRVLQKCPTVNNIVSRAVVHKLNRDQTFPGLMEMRTDNQQLAVSEITRCDLISLVLHKHSSQDNSSLEKDVLVGVFSY